MTRLFSGRTTMAATALAGLLAIGAADVVLTSPGRDESQVLLESEKAWAKAALDGNADLMSSYMAAEYLELVWEPAAPGTAAHWRAVTKASWVDSVRSRKEVYTSVELRGLTVHVQGKLAVVTGEYAQKGTSDGKDISASGIYANTWAKRDGRWLVVHSIFP
ncbi:MAG TPA: nuclear transport factor 2 family protein [Thermoanaerobaculia bacterium]|nr:nuclear transport factor 2 family protein [Thermoanaerobaculia bacterium]